MAACAAYTLAASAQDAREKRMDISGYRFEGRYLLNAQEMTRIVGPLIGGQRSAADIERARSTLQQAYHALGYCEYAVTLAAPEPDNGIVTFRLTELPASETRKCLPRVELAAATAPVARAQADAPTPPRASSPVVPAPRFDINRFEVSGNTLLPAAEIERLVAPFAGKDKDFGDIQRALEALEQAYRDRGYAVVQVALPEQDITQGVVQFRVLQPRVGRVLIDGNTRFDNENVRRSLPTVQEGETPNSRAIARNLQIASEHPVKQTNVLLRSGASDDQIDVNIKVTDDKPWRGFLTLDNTGTGETGYMRLGVGYQHSNLFNRDQTLTAQYVTSPTDLDQVSIYGVGYRAPIYSLNSSLELIAGYSDVDSGTVQGLFTVSGRGTIGAARWNYYLPKAGDVEQKVAFGLDYRAFQNQVLFQGVGVVPDVTVHPASLTYSGLWRGTASELSFYGGVSANIPGGADGDDAAVQAARTGAEANYTILRYGFNYVRQFQNEWQTRLGAGGQYSNDLLVSGEQYGIGGPDSVRGYLLREVASDRGNSAQLELYTPELARGVGLTDSYRLRFLAFYDYGAVDRNGPLPGESAHESLRSAGLGARFGYRKSLVMRVDVAQILQESATRDNTTQRVSAAVAIIY